MLLNTRNLLNRRHMDIHNLKVIATNHSRLLLRSWLFRLFFLFLFGIVFFFQAIEQGNLFQEQTRGLTMLPSFFPYVNAYLFTVLQTIPLIFLAGMFLVKKKNMDTMDAVYSRPESNAEYVWGMFWGFFNVFVVMAVCSLCLGLLLHLFASRNPLEVWIYLFYLVTMIVPALVFMLGLSFFIHVRVRSQGIGVIILLGIVVLLVWGGRGLLDPLGLRLPNVFSSVTGHPNLGAYLLQRLCWFFVGLGLVELSVLCFKRLVNYPLNRKKVARLAVCFLLLGVLAGGTFYFRQVEKKVLRNKYIEVYNKYAKDPKGSVVAHQIDFKQEGKRIVVTSDLVIQNKGTELLDEIVVYLNPALTVRVVKEKDTDLLFEREEQVLRVKRALEPGKTLEFLIEYEGKIDPEVCYLDVPDDILYNEDLNAYSICRYGKQYAFLDDHFTLLVPECLWYPMTVPPVNPAMPYDIPKDFTTYTLRVSGRGDREVVSQGERSAEGDNVVFRHNHPLHGISLCMGEFEKRAIEVDSTRYELYLLKGHGALLNGLEAVQDTLPVLIRDWREVMEYKSGRKYPYAYFLLVETPITFASFYRNNRGGSEFVQPGMAFLPERGMSVFPDVEIVRDYKHYPRDSKMYMEERSEKERCAGLLESCIVLLFEDEERFLRGFDVLERFVVYNFGGSNYRNFYYRDKNPYNVYPMFLNYTISFQSDQFPVMEVVLIDLLKGFESLDRRNEDILEYLKTHSLESAVQNAKLTPYFVDRLLKAKSDELQKRMAVDGGRQEDAITFLKEYLAQNTFRRVRFCDFDTCFSRQVGGGWSHLLADWYSVDHLPAFWVKDFEVANVGKEPKEMTMEEFMERVELMKQGEQVILPGYGGRVHVRATVYNDSDVDGVVSIRTGKASFDLETKKRVDRIRRNTKISNYLVKARRGVEISFTSDDIANMTILDMNLSPFLPREIPFRTRHGENDRYTLDTVQFTRELDRSYFLPAPGEIIIDNEDEGFRLNAPEKKGSFLRRLFNKEPERKMVSFMIEADKGEKVTPGCAIQEWAYGLPLRSFVYMEQGGKASMEWKTSIEQSGEYDLYAYLPEALDVARREKTKRGGMALSGAINVTVSSVELNNRPEIKQYYTIYNDGTGQEVVGTITNPRGWILLGRFRLVAGECRVVLDDRGEPEQILLGDAIKWVRVKDK